MSENIPDLSYQLHVDELNGGDQPWSADGVRERIEKQAGLLASGSHATGVWLDMDRETPEEEDDY